ncbi:MAG: tripartite tricarboxylate transporter substrate binding protein [Burkholderiales bacterium]|jgi:tripartite-type tricarboxylate transporter receptor subunit TctC|nr:tripartite tricarboxylate transporter substrate binding protein [Burkholderiales bacterium]
MINRRRFGAALVAAALSALPLAAHAQAWPQKPIKWVNPFPAGGGTDAFARPLAAQLSKQLGQQVVIENLGGAGGTLGAGVASKAAPDGYTWFVGAVHHTIAVSLYNKLPYDLQTDFVPVTMLALVPNVVVVHPSVPVTSVAELIDYAKKNPGKLNFGSAGNGTSHHLAAELFKTSTGVQMTHIPYKGAGPMMQDLLAGQVDLAFDGMGTSAPQIKGQKLRPLAVTTTTRSPVLPDTPTLQEAGVAGYEVQTWYALWAIKGTPAPIVERMQAEVAKALQDPQLREIWANQSATLGGWSQAQFSDFVKSEIAKWSKVVKDSGAKIDN